MTDWMNKRNCAGLRRESTAPQAADIRSLEGRCLELEDTVAHQYHRIVKLESARYGEEPWRDRERIAALEDVFKVDAERIERLERNLDAQIAVNRDFTGQLAKHNEVHRNLIAALRVLQRGLSYG